MEKVSDSGERDPEASRLSAYCPVRDLLNAVLGKWSSLILLALEADELRFSAIKRALGDISQRVLTQKLRDLERDGYIDRRVVASGAVEVHYSLTPQGHSFLECYKPLVKWAEQHFDRVTAVRQRYDRAAESGD